MSDDVCKRRFSKKTVDCSRNFWDNIQDIASFFFDNRSAWHPVKAVLAKEGEVSLYLTKLVQTISLGSNFFYDVCHFPYCV